LLIFASGTKDGGGSGLEKIIEHALADNLSVDIVGIVSNRESGGVRQIADKYQLPFYHMVEPFDGQTYAAVLDSFKPDFIVLSGWLKKTIGLPPGVTINIHPALLPKFGGSGLYGHYVHEAVIAAFERGEVTQSGVTMHFVTEVYDDGPRFFEFRVPLVKGDTAETLYEKKIKPAEHGWQWFIIRLVITHDIYWLG